MLFEIEEMRMVRNRAYVFARFLEPRSFSLCGQHYLHGYPIEPWIGQPRVLSEGGEPRSDLFSFVLRNVEDLSHLRSGQLVELSPAACGSDQCV
jgi:hypothetical protein